MIIVTSVVLFTSICDVINAADTAFLFYLTSLRNVINAASVALRFNVTLLRNIGNAADAALLFDCRMNNRNMSLFVVC